MPDFYSLYKSNIKGIKQSGSPEQFSGRCNFHEDKNPSFTFNSESGLFHCFSCDISGNAYQFAQAVGIDPKPYSNGTYPQNENTPNHVPKQKRNGDVGEIRDPFLTKADRNRAFSYHKHLLANFDELIKGLPWTREAVKRTFVGYSSVAKCFTYIVTNEKGKALSLKYHKPDENWKGSQQVGNAKSRFYAKHIIKDYEPDIPFLLVEGEPDFISSLSRGLQPITGTGGVSSYKNLDYTQLPKFKEIIIALDADSPGRTESSKIAGKIKATLPDVKIHIHTWKDKPDKYDLTDFLNEGGNAESLIKPEFPEFPVFRGVSIDWKRLTTTTASYLDLSSKTTDAPDEYILMSLLVHWAGLVGNKIKYEDLRPNIWTVLFGKSSEIRKSTAFRIAGKAFNNIQSKFDKGYDEAITKYETELREWEGLTKDEKRDISKPKKPNHVKLILDVDFSDAGFYEMLKNNPLAGVIVTAEFADFNQKLKRDYTNQANAFLTAYDGDRMSRITRTHGTEIIQNPAFSILGATTIKNFTKVFSATEVENGFLQRIFPVVLLEPTKKRMLFLDRKELEKDSLKLFEDMAMNWFRHDGEIEAILTEELKESFGKWEEKFITESKEKHGTDISPNLERMIPGCLKLAMLLESMQKENPPEKLIISKQSLECAKMITENFFLPSLVYLMENEIIFDRNLYDESQIGKTIIAAGGFIDRTELMRTTRISKKRMDEITETMIEKGMIEVHEHYTGRGQGGGNAKKVYQWID